MTETAPSLQIRALSTALAALGTYAEEPADADVVTAEHDEGEPALRARLSNALYGTALARALETEVAATGQPGSGNYRRDAWTAAGADGEGVMILLHYTAMRLACDLGGKHERVTTDLGVLRAANGTSQALKLLLEVLTVPTTDQPRAENITPHLARAADQLETAAEQLRSLFAAGCSLCSGAGPAGDASPLAPRALRSSRTRGLVVIMPAAGLSDYYVGR